MGNCFQSSSDRSTSEQNLIDNEETCPQDNPEDIQSTNIQVYARHNKRLLEELRHTTQKQSDAEKENGILRKTLTDLSEQVREDSQLRQRCARLDSHIMSLDSEIANLKKRNEDLLSR